MSELDLFFEAGIEMILGASNEMIVGLASKALV